MKKVLSLFLAVLVMIPFFALTSSAENENEKIVIELRSDISGLCADDYEKLAQIKSGNIAFDTVDRDSPIIIADYAGNVYFDKMKPGRDYTIDYLFVPVNGYEIPDDINEKDIEFICPENCTVWWYGKAVGACVDGVRSTYIMVYTEVRVDGNLFQNIFGRLADIFLKIKAWSPY